MRKLILLTLISFILLSASYGAENNNLYRIDDQQVEKLFSSSVDVSLSSLKDVNTTGINAPFNGLLATNTEKSASYYAGGDKNFITAFLLDFFLGGLGIHRIYLGTKTLTWVGYILTCGGIGGIVPFVDLIVLIIHNDDISPYVDNPKFFMWSGK